jgi:hypothetical protein
MEKKLMRATTVTCTLGIILISVSLVFAAAPKSGKARIPQDMATVDQLFNACQDAVIEAGYTINSIDRAGGLISASNETRLIGSKKSNTYTWNISIRSKDSEKVNEILMSRSNTGYFTPSDIPKLLIYVSEQLKLDLAKVEITYDEETKKASEWKDD